MAKYHNKQHTHQPLQTYELLLSSGEEPFIRYILAKDKEDAAWTALDVAKQFNSELLDISPHEEN
jgi:hypothetical protein